jgi:hypothetical protein
VSLAEEYAASLHLVADKLTRSYEFKFGHLLAGVDSYSHRELPRELPHVVAEFVSGRLDVRGNSAYCLTHGDLHGENVYVQADGSAAWLLDFAATGVGHWARDFAQLEAYIRYQLVNVSDLRELYDWEVHLCNGDLNEAPALPEGLSTELIKATVVIARLRRVAASLMSEVDSRQLYREYLFAVCVSGLKYIDLHRLLDKKWRKHHVMAASGVMLAEILQ